MRRTHRRFAASVQKLRGWIGSFAVGTLLPQPTEIGPAVVGGAQRTVINGTALATENVISVWVALAQPEAPDAVRFASSDSIVFLLIDPDCFDSRRDMDCGLWAYERFCDVSYS